MSVSGVGRGFTHRLPYLQGWIGDKRGGGVYWSLFACGALFDSHLNKHASIKEQYWYHCAMFVMLIHCHCPYSLLSFLYGLLYYISLLEKLSFFYITFKFECNETL